MGKKLSFDLTDENAETLEAIKQGSVPLSDKPLTLS